MRLPFVLAITIDVECDKDTAWQVRHPLSFRGVADGIGAVLDPLFREYGARPTYLLSPEVLRHPESSALLAPLPACELGTHLHHEFITGWDDVLATSTVSSLGPGGQEAEDLGRLTELFMQAFGRSPVSFRAGRFGASERTLEVLEDLGYLVDTSVTPLKNWSFLDFSGAPAQPYYPSAGDIAVRGAERRLLEVPVTLRPTSARPWLRKAAALAARTRLRSLRRMAKRAREPVWLRPGWSTRRQLLGFVRQAAREPGTVLNMMFHNVDVVNGLSMNATSEDAVAKTLDGIRAVLEAVHAAGGGFATLSEVRRYVLEAPLPQEPGRVIRP